MAGNLILLPPSEGKASGGGGPPWKRGSMALDLDRERVQVVTALEKAMNSSESSRSTLLGVKSRALSAATDANRTVKKAKTLPVIERYTGVLYDALDYDTLPATQRRRLDSSVVIFSGLWGLVMPRDPIPDYKLKMGANLPGLGKLSGWWRGAITEELERKAKDRTVWNLLPNEHAAAWQPAEYLTRFTVRFLEPGRGGKLVAVAHRNKSLLGAFVRFAASNASIASKDLRAWKAPGGFRYQPKLDEERGAEKILSFVGR